MEAQKSEAGKLAAKAPLPDKEFWDILEGPPVPARPLKLDASMKLLARAERVIPGASQTYSKGPSQFVRGVAPLFLDRGDGCHVWDVDGNEFIDTMMALAPVTLGYRDPDVDSAVSAQMESGTVLSLPHPLEVDVAEAVCAAVPCAEMVRFCKNGSDATAAAVRLARAATGRDVIAACGYHGWQDWTIGASLRPGGVPEAVRALTKTFQYNKIDTLEKVFDENPGRVAAVILEPIGVEEPRERFLERVASLARRHGAVLIFDEVITGFRLAVGGAQEHFKVTPDLACFGKAMANGYPLAAVAGKAELLKLMEKEVFFSSTFGGELLSLAAGSAAIAKIRKEPIIQHLWRQGDRLRDGYNAMSRALGLERFTSCVGLGPRTMIDCKAEDGSDWWELKSLLQQECVRRGHLFTGSNNVCYALSNADVLQLLKVYASALRAAAEAVRSKTVKEKLEGPPLEPVFRRA